MSAGKLAVLAGFAAGLLVPAGVLGAEHAARVVQVGFVFDGSWDRNLPVADLVRTEVAELLGGQYDVRFPLEARIEGDWTPQGASAALDRLLAARDVDIVIAMGVLASDQACRRSSLQKPVIAPAVIDARVQGLPDRDGRSGVHNLAYLTVPSAVARDLRAFHDLVPFERLTVLVNRYITASLPGLAEQLHAQLAEHAITPVVIGAGASARAALEAIPRDTEAVYLLPLLQLSTASFDSLVAGIRARKLPSFSCFGAGEVERGVLAGVNPDLFPRMARRIAVTVQRILAGEDAGTIPTSFAVGERLLVNLDTARAIGFFPNWAALAEAETIGDAGSREGPELTLVGVMQEALAANRDLEAAAKRVEAGRHEVRQALAPLLPQADASATGVLIDADRARASLGTQAERTLSASASASQVVFSESALARLSITQHQQRAREEEREAVRLDVVREAGAAYLTVLRAQTLERIQRENLRLTRDHLELARGREAAGSSSLADVYRWESEIASNRKSAIEANASRNLAEVELNRIRHRPLEEPFSTHEAALADSEVARVLGPYQRYFADKRSFLIFRDFLAEDGRLGSPEIRQLDAAIAATRRSLASTNRSFILPSLALQGQVSNVLDESGAGSEPLSIPGLTGEPADDTDWSIGLRADLPLFRGGGRIAERGRARREIERLEAERDAAAERIEQRVRSALHRAGASYAGIRESRQAAEWAGKNLALVTDAYSRGAVSLIDLLDAQNAHTVADEAAADAVYDFLDDFLEVQRAIGRFDFLMTPEERDDLQARLREYAVRAGEPRER